uniref:Bet v I/Major latex protein domain-containing protein n=1 Tax=Glycine max TaxID=3847 RepID=K7ME84_SOYBN
MAYSQLQKLEANVSIKASAEQFYDVLCHKTHQIPKIFPEKALSVEILKGAWGTEGSIISWNYLYVCVAKEVIEGIDKKNKKMSFKVIEGDVLGHYKSFKFIMQVTPKEKGSVVQCVVEYEKQKDHIPDPHTLLQSTVELCKKINAYLTQDNN